MPRKALKGAAFALATVFLTVMLKVIELAILDEANETRDLMQVLAVQYEFIVIAVSILIGGHTAVPATPAYQQTFFWPLLIVVIIALGTLCSLVLAVVVVAPLISAEHTNVWVESWFTIVVPDLLGITAIVVAVFSTLKVGSRT